MISKQRMTGHGAGDAMIRLLASRASADLGKTEIIKYLASIVNDGFAKWAELANGDVELTLLSGETFHLGEATVTRVG
jgi:hypothetical protein